MVWTVIVALVGSLLGAGGVAYAADGAAPGNALYGVDLAIEGVQTDLTKDPEASVALQLAFAEERLLESQAVSASGDSEAFYAALDGYGDAVAAIAQTVQRTPGGDEGILASMIDEAFAEHDLMLVEILDEPGDDDDGEDDEDDGPGGPCTGTITHPVGARTAQRYDVTYGDIMGWFCDSHAGFGEISRAYSIIEQVGEETGATVDDLFALREEGYGWGQIMQEYELIGRAAHHPAEDDESEGEEPPGGEALEDEEDADLPGNGKRPDHAGPPEGDDEEKGKRPDHAGKPDDEERGRGRPEDLPIPPGQAKKNDEGGPAHSNNGRGHKK
jgi:hypothetical protein